MTVFATIKTVYAPKYYCNTQITIVFVFQPNITVLLPKLDCICPKYDGICHTLYCIYAKYD